MVCAVGSFENINEDEEWLQSNVCELCVSTWQTDITNAALKQKGEEECEIREGQSSECISHSVVVLRHPDTLLD
jgi:hypothetical protein